MNEFSAAFFSWVQGAQFYIDVHSDAVNLLPEARETATWLDVGCGPGLVARLAARRGYEVTGVDRDPEMIARAERLWRQVEQCRFEAGDLVSIEGRTADVVSAASLLFVVPDPAAALRQLWHMVRPGGKLLIVETTAAMTPKNAFGMFMKVRPGRRLALALWAQARGGRTIDAAVFPSLPGVSVSKTILLGGKVAAWIFERPPI